MEPAVAAVPPAQAAGEQEDGNGHASLATPADLGRERAPSHDGSASGDHRPGDDAGHIAARDQDADGDEAGSDEEETADGQDTADADALDVFRRRILPIMQSARPSSCAECHLSGVDLKQYIREDQAATFASLKQKGLIDVDEPENSKILEFIRRRPESPNLLSDRAREEEFAAFRAWILAAVQEPELLEAAAEAPAVGGEVPVEVIRHARKDRVLASFIENVWSELGRCAACHSPDRNQEHVKKHGDHVSWITPGDPRDTFDYMSNVWLIDPEEPESSPILTKPTLQVDHGGGQKMVIGDRTYKQFRRFIDDYAAVVNGEYASADDLPGPAAEVSAATEIWLRLTGVPDAYDKCLLQVDLHRREGDGWSRERWATGDRLVHGERRLWQQHLSVTAPRDSERAEELRRHPALPSGEYLVRIFVDREGKLQEEYPAELGEEELVAEIVVDSLWPKGHGNMTIVPFPE